MPTFRRLSLFIIPLALGSCNGYQNDGPVVDETYVHRYGMEVPQENWRTTSGESGQVISTLKNGVVVNKTYDSGVLHGPSTYTFPHSDAVQRVEHYNQGNVEKETIHYFSGAPYQEKQYNGDDHIMTNWYETGAPQSREEYQNGRLVKGEYYNPEHQLESSVENGSGTRTRRDSYGLILSIDTISNGQLSLRTTYHPNGTPKEITPFVNNLPEGEKKTFLPAGEPYTIETWAAGKQQGITVVFLHGEKVAEVPYKDGQKNGVEQRFRDGQIVVEEISWVNGQKHGPTKIYLGSTPTIDWYFKDQKVSQSNYDMMNRPLQR